MTNDNLPFYGKNIKQILDSKNTVLALKYLSMHNINYSFYDEALLSNREVTQLGGLLYREFDSLPASDLKSLLRKEDLRNSWLFLIPKNGYPASIQHLARLARKKKDNVD